MKKLFFTIVAACALLMTACEKDPENLNPQDTIPTEDPQQENLLLGEWRIDLNNSLVHEDYDGEVDDYSLNEIGLLEATYEFREDGIVVVYSNFSPTEIYYDTMDYVVSGNQIIMDKGFEVYTIEKLEKNNLQLFYTYEEDNYSSWSRYVFTK